MHGVTYQRVGQPQHAAKERDAAEFSSLGIASEGINQSADHSDDEWPNCDQHDRKATLDSDLTLIPRYLNG